jgi:methylase of polypeptide subunit release factors
MNRKDVFGLKIQVNEHVFSPKYAEGYKNFIPFLPDVKGMKVLEVGCGHGLVSCYFAKRAKSVLAVDINPYAVENTRINAEHNNLKNIEVRKSDVFSNIQNNEKYDLIFWNIPWAKIPKENEKSLKPEDYAVFDVEHQALSRFILESRNYLTKNGSACLFYGLEGADIDLISNIIKKAEAKKEIIKTFIFEEKTKEEKIMYHAELIRLKYSIL